MKDLSPSTINLIVFGCLFIMCITFGRSIVLMFGGKKLFEKAKKNPVSAYYPVINLFTLLDICEMNSFLGILLFLPFTNIVILAIMSIKLGKLFNTTKGFRFGMVVFPIIFYPLLCNSDKNYKLTDEEYFRALDNAKDETINLLTDEEIKEQNKLMEEEVSKEKKEDVDSIFKSEISMKEKADPYHAKQVDILAPVEEDDKPPENPFEPIKRVEVKPKEEEEEEEVVEEKSKFTDELNRVDKAEFLDL